MAETHPHHVIVAADRDCFDARLREIEAWLAEWQVDAEIGTVLGERGVIRVRFSDERAAYAFQRVHGGRAVPAGEIAAALGADAADEGLYDRLAREYPD